MDLNDNSNSTSTPSLRRPPAQQDSQLDPDRHHIYRRVVGMLIWASQVRPDLQLTAKDHTRHLSSPTEWDWTHLKRTLRYIKGTMHYKFLIPTRQPQGHSLPLRQLVPLHINTYCGSDWATDIDSRKSTSGTVTSVLQVPLAFNSRTQSTIATSSAEAKLYAIGLGISDSLHIYQLLPELQYHLQKHTFSIQHHYLDTAKPLTSTTSPIHISPTAHLLLASATSLDSTSVPSTSLCATFMQDIQTTGLVNIQKATSHNNPADICTKCVTSPVLERHLRHNGIIEVHIEEGEINYFHILEIAEQYFNDDENIVH